MNQSNPELIFNQQLADEIVRVWQQDNRRWLDFDDGLIQSEIDLNRPEYLPLVLNRAMLAGIIFVERPQRVLLAGTGGGATARYFSSRFPDVYGEAVEKSDTVIQLAQKYFNFPNTKNWQLISGDIVDYVEQCQQQYDLIIIDIAVNQKTPKWIIERQFLQQCRSILTAQGEVVFNLLVDDANDFMHYLSAIRDSFDRRTVCLSLPNYRNTVVMAFNQKPAVLIEDITAQLPDLEVLWGLELTTFYQQMLIDNPKNSGVF